MSREKKVLFNGPVLRVEQSDLGVHLKDQWGKGGITAHTSTSELRDALRVFISSVEGEEMELVRKREPRAESSIYASWVPPFRYNTDGVLSEHAARVQVSPSFAKTLEEALFT